MGRKSAAKASSTHRKGRCTVSCTTVRLLGLPPWSEVSSIKSYHSSHHALFKTQFSIIYPVSIPNSLQQPPTYHPSFLPISTHQPPFLAHLCHPIISPYSPNSLSQHLSPLTFRIPPKISTNPFSYHHLFHLPRTPHPPW